MVLLLTLVLLAALLNLGVRGQFVPPPTDLKEAVGHAGITVRYKEVPTGTCELDPGVKSFSGYADVGDDEHIFFWFFEKRGGDAGDAPLTVWLNGGPGASSMIGLFQELGPCGIDYFGSVYSNPFSWSNVSNLLFIDQPTQVGFSYSKVIPGFSRHGQIVALPEEVCPDYATDCGSYSYPDLTRTANSTINAAPNFWKALQGFMGVFPQYSSNGLVIGTESYGGHYGPVFSAYIERQNERAIPGAKHIQQSALLVGNGWFDPITQFQSFYNFSLGNTYDLPPINESVRGLLFNSLYGPGNCLDQLNECKSTGEDSICSKADKFCSAQVERLYTDVMDRDWYDIRYLNPDPFPYSFFEDYLNKVEVQSSIGAYTNFSLSSNGATWLAFSNTGDDSRQMDTIPDIRYLLSRGVTVALYAGDADCCCNWLGVEAVAEQVTAAGFAEAGFADLRTSDGVVHGQVKQAGGFSFTRFFESGHMVPFYQPLAALEFFNRTIRQLDIETGNHVVDVAYRTKGPWKSTYHQGNATVQWEVIANNMTYDPRANGPGEPWRRRLEETTTWGGMETQDAAHQFQGPQEL